MISIRRVWVVASALVPLALAASASAQDTCNGLLAIEYVTVQSPNTAGSIDRVKLSIGAGSIGGGNMLAISRLAYGLDCKSRVCSNASTTACADNGDCPGGVCLSILPTCIDDGSVVGYVGNITTTCPGVSWSANSSGGGTPNEVMFTASTPVMIPEGTFPFCELEFDFIKLASASNDSTPNLIEQTAGFDMASCNNGLNAASAISGAVTVRSVDDTVGPLPAPAMSSGAAILVALGLGAVGRRRLRRRRA